MSKVSVGILVFVSVLICLPFDVHAQLKMKGAQAFGGQIEKIKNQRIEELEKDHVCIYVGDTFDIKPANSKFPKNYFAAPGTKKTKYQLTVNQAIIGTYQGKQQITCTRFYPYDVQTVSLDNVKIYATSKSGSGGGNGGKTVAMFDSYLGKTKEKLVYLYNAFTSKVREVAFK